MFDTHRVYVYSLLRGVPGLEGYHDRRLIGSGTGKWSLRGFLIEDELFRFPCAKLPLGQPVGIELGSSKRVEWYRLIAFERSGVYLVLKLKRLPFCLSRTVKQVLYLFRLQTKQA